MTFEDFDKWTEYGNTAVSYSVVNSITILLMCSYIVTTVKQITPSFGLLFAMLNSAKTDLFNVALVLSLASRSSSGSRCPDSYLPFSSPSATSPRLSIPLAPRSTAFS